MNFEIHFGKGIREHEQVFDFLRKHGAGIVDGKEIHIAGSAAWKTLVVTNVSTGEILVEKKFYKNEFDEVWNNPNYGKYVNALLSAAMIRKLEEEEMDVDVESYEEIRSISMEGEEILIDPEA